MISIANDNKRKVVYSAKFKKDYRKSLKQGKSKELVDWVIHELANDRPLPEKFCDHALTGNWLGYRECHVNPDWLLIYKKNKKGELTLTLFRLASHSELDF